MDSEARREGGEFPGSVVREAVRDAEVGRTPAADPVGAVRRFRKSLAVLDLTTLTDAEQVDLVAELERVKGSAAAAQARATHALRVRVEERCPQDAVRSVGAMVSLARRQSPALGDRFVGIARALVTELPHTLAALQAGVCGERHVLEVVQQSAVLGEAQRALLDERVAPLLGRLGVKGIGHAARRVAAELDAASVVARMEAAVGSRRVTVRPAPDGMAYLTVLGPMKDVVGAFAALQARSKGVVGGQRPEEPPDGRGVGAVAADTALRLLSGRGIGQVTPVEVHLVMTDRSLLGFGDPDRSVFEPARVPGQGPLPAPVARAWLREGLNPALPTAGDTAASVWVRRLYTSPDGRDLVAMDSRRRTFTGLLRRMLVLRDDVCTTPWCESPIAHADHTVPAREGTPTTFQEGSGRCARCNHGKEAPGWRAHTTRTPTAQPDGRPGDMVPRRVLHLTTPLGHTYPSSPPPLLGWGSRGTPAPDVRPRADLRPASGDVPTVRGRVPTVPGRVPTAGAGSATPTARRHGRAKRSLGRPRHLRRPSPTRRPRVASHLERELCRYLS